MIYAYNELVVTNLFFIFFDLKIKQTIVTNSNIGTAVEIEEIAKYLNRRGDEICRFKKR